MRTIKETVVEQYYYRVSGCKAKHPTDPDCICWHDKGTGPLADGKEELRLTWRTKPNPDKQRIAELEDRITELEDRIAELEAVVNMYKQSLKTQTAYTDNATKAVMVLKADAEKRIAELEGIIRQMVNKNLAQCVRGLK